MLCLHRPIPVRSLFKHIHSGQGNVEPLARDSFGSSNNLLATVCRWADHAVTLAVAGFVTRGSVECMKLSPKHIDAKPVINDTPGLREESSELVDQSMASSIFDDIVKPHNVKQGIVSETADKLSRLEQSVLQLKSKSAALETRLEQIENQEPPRKKPKIPNVLKNNS